MVEKQPIETADIQEQKRKFRRTILKRTLFIIAIAILLIVIAGFSLSLGSAPISFFEAYGAIFAHFWPDTFSVSPLAGLVVWELRLPRMLLALLAGASLAMPGATTQSILRNPLATPYTLGVSAGAGLGAAIGIILGKGITDGPLLIISNAFIFSLIPVIVILLLVKHKGASPETMILSGIAITYVFSAVTTLLQYFSEANAVAATVFWIVGDLSRAAWWQLPYILVVFLISLIINILLSMDLNVMKMGDDTAKSLGVNVERSRTISMVLACLCTATVVSFTGPIGFICLLAPHICRIFIGGDERFVMFSSCIVGAILLLVADIVARRLIAPIVLPVGAITALIGGPLLLILLIRHKTNH